MPRKSDAQTSAQLALAELTELLAASRRVAGLLDSAVLAQRAANEARRLAGTQIATLAVLEDPALLIMRGTAGTRTPEIERLHIPRGTGLGGRVVLEGRAIEVPDYAIASDITHDHVDVVAAAEGIRAVLGVPIDNEHEVLGILYGGLRDVGSIGDRGRSLLVEFARSLGPVLGAAREAERAQRLRVAAERQRVAVQLHDSLGQLLFGIGVAARRAQAASSSSAGPSDLLARLEEIEAGASRAASELREALRELAPTTPESALAIALRTDTDAFTARTGVAAHFVVVGDPLQLRAPLPALLLGVVREGLHNAEKYARASSVMVTLFYGAGSVGVVVQDDGVGLPPQFGLEPLPRTGRGLGLASLLQRTQQLGGTLILMPNEDGGVTLRANLPARARG